MEEKPQNVKELMDKYHEYQKLNAISLDQIERLKERNETLETEINKQNTLNKEYIKQIKDLEKIKTELLDNNDTLKMKNKEYQNHISNLEKEKIESDKANSSLTKEVSEVINSVQKIEIELDRVSKETDISEIKFEPNMYLKGKFLSFNFENNSLHILIEGKDYFYPLSDYQCEYLPSSGARVLVFNSKDGNKIFGFNKSNVIPPAMKIEAIIKSIMPKSSSLKLLTKEFGFITVQVPVFMIEENKFTPSRHIICKITQIDGNYYFTIDNTNIKQHNTTEILKLIQG